MPRASAKIVLFLVCLNASAAVFSASGVAADWGVEPTVGGDNFITDIRQEAKTLGASFGSASYLIGVIVDLALLALSIFEFVFAAPIMFGNLGAPGWLTTFVFAPQYAIVLFDGMYLYTGRSV